MNSLFSKIRVSSKIIKQNTSVIGWYVLSYLLKKKIYQYLDLLTEGSVIFLVQKIFKNQNPIFTFFRRFETFRIKKNGFQIEFITHISIYIYYNIAISLYPSINGLLIDYLIYPRYNYIFTIIKSIRFSSELELIKQMSFYCFFEKKEYLFFFYKRRKF